jgi:hypothetical protein
MPGMQQNTEQQLGTKCSTRYVCCTKANGRKTATATTDTESNILSAAENVDEPETAAEFTYAITRSAAAIFVAINTDAVFAATHDANIIWPSAGAVKHSADTADGNTVNYPEWYTTEFTEFSSTICAITTPAAYTICYEATATSTAHASTTFSAADSNSTAAQSSFATTTATVNRPTVKFATKSVNWSTE